MSAATPSSRNSCQSASHAITSASDPIRKPYRTRANSPEANAATAVSPKIQTLLSGASSLPPIQSRKTNIASGSRMRPKTTNADCQLVGFAVASAPIIPSAVEEGDGHGEQEEDDPVTPRILREPRLATEEDEHAGCEQDPAERADGAAVVSGKSTAENVHDGDRIRSVRRSAGAHGEPELAQLRLVDRRRRAGERVGAGGGLRERDHVADRVGAGEPLDDAVEAVGDAAVRRRAVAKRLEQEAEALARPPRRRSRAPRGPAAGARGRRYGSSRRRAPGRSRPRRRRAPGRRPGRSGSSSPAGEVNGWWSGSQRLSSSFHSNSGQSTIQQNSLRVGGRSARSARRGRAQLGEHRVGDRAARRRRPAAGRPPRRRGARSAPRAPRRRGTSRSASASPRPRGTPRRAPWRRAPAPAR